MIKMKKTFAVILALLLAIGMFAGCNGNPGPNAPAASKAPQANGNDATPAPVSGSKTGKLSDSYNTYLEVKSAAFERLTKEMETNSDLAMMGMTFLSITLVDLTLIPMTVVSEDSSAAGIGLGILGMKDVKVTNNGGVYTITYTDSNDKKMKQTCQYDAGTDSVQSTISDESGNETMFFEYVKVGSGYAAQYYSVGDNGAEIMTAFFDATSMAAFGVQKASAKPASIFRNSGVTVDLVKGADTYAIMDGDKLTIHENGADKTY
jgi:hypothetical protein